MLNVEFKNIHQVKDFLKSIKSNTILVLSSSSAERWDLTDSIGSDILWINEVDSNPTPKTLFNSLEKIKQSGKKAYDIIAIGGGSTIDLAKCIIAFLPAPQTILDSDSLRDSIRNKDYLNYKLEKKPLFTALPTTSGTGSESTQWATIWDNSSPTKFSVDAPWLIPDHVILSPHFTLCSPIRLTAATGLDAASHAVESYWARASDSLSKQLALAALHILVPELYNLNQKHDSDNLKWRENLTTGAYLSGLAFSRTRTTACHSLSYPITSIFGVEHGFAVALTLDSVAQENSKAVDLYPLFQIFEPYGGIKAWIDSVTENIQEMKLSSFGITEKDIPIIIEHAFTAGRMDNNPVELSKLQIENILKLIL